MGRIYCNHYFAW